MLTANILEARGVTRAFGATRALAGVDLVVERGHVLALLGPNGAGKTTFVRAVATLVRIDAGTLIVNGHDVRSAAARVRRSIGLAGQYPAVEGAMTGRENLRMIARLYGHDALAARTTADQLLQRLGLADAGDRLARTYSGGMRRKLDLAMSLVSEPALLLLDEPTAGLDPPSRIELWDTIRGLVRRGTSVLLTTQYLEEADHLADRIAIMDHGRIIAAGAPDELKDRAGRDVIEVRVHDGGDVSRAAEAIGALQAGAVQTDPQRRLVTVGVTRGTERLAEVVRALDDERVPVAELTLRRPTLDEIFLSLTGHGAASDAPTATPRTAPTATREVGTEV
jgi:ABC-2 type transport system ATP-binding protein